MSEAEQFSLRGETAEIGWPSIWLLAITDARSSVGVLRRSSDSARK